MTRWIGGRSLQRLRGGGLVQVTTARRATNRTPACTASRIARPTGRLGVRSLLAALARAASVRATREFGIADQGLPSPAELTRRIAASSTNWTPRWDTHPYGAAIPTTTRRRSRFTPRGVVHRDGGRPPCCREDSSTTPKGLKPAVLPRARLRRNGSNPPGPAARVKARCRLLRHAAGDASILRRGLGAVRPAPCYDFTAPTHPGALFYDCFPGA